ncbi:MAG: hypothetical protein Tp1124DCM412911_6 [Prokaryotic dsDNA virus sp.]|nr:MAG: hypothetical protein Tp1124DCM412911_6 [Prokaryotic dsDNA virus sp.]|tara:strand:+ start:15667 stop:16071 length:405 start_codon:yes stop_codon:yes gene_type:complete
MPFASTPNLAAGGTIRPYRFVKCSTAADNTGLEADDNERAIGVASGDTKSHDSANHAEDGDQISLQTGAVVLVEAGGSITRGKQCTSDADGKATAATESGTTVQEIAGICLESAASGTIFRMLWQPSQWRPALS